MHVSSITQCLNKILCVSSRLLENCKKLDTKQKELYRPFEMIRVFDVQPVHTHSHRVRSQVVRWVGGGQVGAYAQRGKVRQLRAEGAPKSGCSFFFLPVAAAALCLGPSSPVGSAHFFFFFWIYDPNYSDARERDFSAFLLCLCTTSLNSQLCRDRCLIEYRISIQTVVQ